VSSPELESARQQWQEGSRRLEQTRRDPLRHRRLLAQVDTVTMELRRRVGQTFTLAELADAYRTADAWGLEAIEARDSDAGWERDAALVADAAFHLYSSGAVDYAP